MTHAYRLARLKLESELELAGLDPWDGAKAVQPDVALRLDRVPLQLEKADHVEAIFQTRGRDEYLLSLDGTGRILIRHGREITLDLEAGADLTNTSALLTGSMQAVLWHQRGLLPLQANAVVVNGRAVLLAGRPAIGKSALAATLCNAGHATLSDDVCVIDASPAGEQALAFPGTALLRLWRDTLDDFGIDTDGLRPALSEKQKFFVVPPMMCRDARPLSAVAVLAGRVRGAPTIERLRGVAAVRALRETIHTYRAAQALGRANNVFAAVTRLANTGATICYLRVPHGPAGLRDAAARIPSILKGSV